jgi:hypothetical protein
LPPPTTPPGAILTPQSALPIAVLGALSLSYFPSSTRHRADPPFPLWFSLTRPLIWRSHRCLTLLCSTSTPELELPSLSTTYAPTSPAPATGDPSSLIPARAPPPSAIIGEHDRTLSLHLNGLTPHLLPPSPTLQGHTIDVIHHWSYLTAIERRRPKHPPPPPLCAAAQVSSAHDCLARCPLGSIGAHANATATPSPPTRSRHCVTPERSRSW